MELALGLAAALLAIGASVGVGAQEPTEFVLGPWREVAHLPVGRFIHETRVVGDHLVVLGGSTGAREAADVFVAPIKPDGTLGAWKATTPLPLPTNYPAAAVHARTIYVLSGATKGHKLHNRVYAGTLGSDGRIERWQTTALLPEDCRSGGAGVAWGTHVYYVGGFYRRQVYRAPVQPDGLLGPWVTDQHLLSPRMGFGVVAHKGSLYAVAGAKTIHDPTDTVYRTRVGPDGSLGRWQRTTPLPKPNTGFGTVLVDDRIVVLGGTGYRNDTYTARIQADGRLGQWRADRPLPVHVALASAAAHKGRVYHVGGWVQKADGKKIISWSVHMAEVRRPLRYALRFRLRNSPDVVKSLGWLELRRAYVQQAGGPVAIEAERSTAVELASSDMRPVRDKGASARRCIQHVSRLENSIVIDRPGTYRAWYRAYFPISASWNHHEQMDDGPRQTVHDSNRGPAKVWLWTRGPTYKLTKGTHAHVFPAPTAWRGGTRLDKIVLTPEGADPPSAKGPDASPVRVPTHGELVSNRFRLDEMRAWRLAYDKDESGGRVEIHYSYDRGKTWQALPGDKLMSVTPPIKRLTFRLRLVAGPHGTSPRVRNLALIGYPTAVD